jgi:hypothetical protein
MRCVDSALQLLFEGLQLSEIVDYYFFDERGDIAEEKDSIPS